MKRRILSVFLLAIMLMSVFSVSVFADDNATGGSGTTHAASDGFGWYNTNQCMWKATLFVGKSDQATKQSSLTNDFYRVGTAIIKKDWTMWAPFYFGNAIKIDYYGGTALKLKTDPGVAVIIDGSMPNPPILCGKRNIEEVKSYFGSTGTLKNLLYRIALYNDCAEYDLLKGKSFTIGGVTKSGWPSDYLLPNGTTNRVPWVIVYEPMVTMHLKDGETKVAFTATEYVLAAEYGWYDWYKSGGSGQNVAIVPYYHLPSSVQLEESWFGYPVYPTHNDSYKWPVQDVIKGGGWGMRWLPVAIQEPMDTGKDYSVSITAYDAAPKVGEKATITIRWENNKGTAATVPVELYQNGTCIWTGTKTIPGNSSVGSVISLTYSSVGAKTMTAKINYADRSQETNPNNNTATVTVNPYTDVVATDYGVYFGPVAQPEANSYGSVSVNWKNYKSTGGTVLCELYLGDSLVWSGNKTFGSYELITSTYSVYYAGSGTKTLTAKINYAHKDEETDPSDNMRTTTVSIASPIDSTYDFSVSNISVTPSAAYQGDYVTVSFISDNWNHDVAYSGIPLEVLVGDTVVKTEYVSFSAYGRNSHSYSIRVDDAGTQTVTARINWTSRYSESNSTNNSTQTTVDVKKYYEFSVSSITVTPSEVYEDETVTISFRTDSWDQRNAYTNIPVQVLYNEKVVYTEYVNYSAYGINYHTVTLNVGNKTGSIPVTARVNWQNHLSEVNTGNNETETKYVVVKPKIDLGIEAIAPNSDYREGMTVITSFMMHNNSAHDIIPTDGNIVKFIAYYYSGSSKTVISEQTWKQTVIPAHEDNLVYFKWTVPKIAGKNVYCEAEINADGTVEEYLDANNKDSLIQTVASVVKSQTPDTQYEREKPTDYSIPAALSAKAGSTTWSMWEYSNGKFSKKTYGLAISSTAPSVTPDTDSPSAVYDGGRWSMKSGYGITLNYAPSIVSISGATLPSASAYTAVQRAEAIFPEFKYSTAQNSFRTLEKVSGKWQFVQNENADGNERLHFTPIWFPDGNYVLAVVATDVWTPAGMIESRRNANTINITESAYDDWYVRR